MSCEECKRIDEEKMIIYYCWGKARIGIVACEEHARGILIALDKAQRNGIGVIHGIRNRYVERVVRCLVIGLGLIE